MPETPKRPPLREFPPHAAAALFLERQHLARPGRLRLTAATLERFVGEAGGLQIDTINVLDRAHYLTLWSRFGSYDRAKLERLIYREHVLFEYWAHAACFVPAAHLPAWRRAMLDYGVHHTGWSRFLRRNAKLLDATEAEIRERGPLGNSDFPQKRPRGGWWSWKPVTHALHYLWMKGRTLVDSRRHFQKRFAVAERVLPAIETVAPLPAEEFARWHTRLALHAMGAATEADLRMYLTFPRTPAPARRKVLESLVRSGEAVEISLAGDRTRWFALAEDLPHLARAARRRAGTPPSRGTTFLAPFDSFLWHRARTSKLFGFDYTIEVYVPGHKRVHGYYSLPILHDGRLIGRVDAKTHREARRLELRHVHFEPWFANGGAPPLSRWGDVDRAAALVGIAGVARSLATFVGADRVTLGRVTPVRLRARLTEAIQGRS
jgi:uncharacterized protein YcaQ